MSKAHEPRPLTDPRVREILAAFDRYAASPGRAHADGAGWLDGWMACVADTVRGRFTVPSDWTDEGIRAVLVAVLVHAPDPDLDSMLDTARSEARDLPGYEATPSDDEDREAAGGS